MAAINIHCPTCGQLDKVAKVSAILANQTSTSSGTAQTYVASEYGHWDSAPYSGTQISNLAIKLERPKPPKVPSKSDIAQGCGWLFLLGGCYFGYGGYKVLSGLLAGTTKDVLFSIGLAGVLLFTGVATIVRTRSDYSKKKREAQDMLPRWEQADKRWNQLFYCDRDETVFNPHDGASMPIENMNKYLYS